ncbi:BofC C-terminal domain-containing protein [Tissierella creatinophila]|uniref:Bypass of forespore C C-terminal domain-containing protein n=1 Tax=Tissierella creatinophila DSM 6911 TaxID=1123403 RepID=A0A1U7M2W6_TISCR|nr:BofC C-terminal domain-containing protein [Tissierella creatinophila]OLS01663.1 hypothetical protein TICRE_22630 [Tissierella creatinophila DSM 6911]
MKKNKFIIIFTISAGLFLLSFSLGYQLVMQKPNQKLISSETNKAKKTDKDIAIIKEEEKITPNTIVEERVLYKECGDLIINNKTPSTTIINMTKEEYDNHLMKESSFLRIISFSSNKIVLWGEKDFMCDKHFIIGEEDGKIAIFKIGPQGERVLDKIFEDYPVEMLMELDQEKIEKGIRIDSEEELSDVLENFIS